MSSISKCSLQCSNGGYCKQIATDDAIALEKDAHAGKLIEECVCEAGWTGVGCSVPCDLNENGEYTCDCNIAQSVSSFAGFMCQNPATEYCYSKIHSDGPNSYCTNGGKCISHPIEDPLTFKHLGCQCPREFSGPHCEYLLAPGTKIDAEGNESRMSIMPFVVASIVLVIAGVGFFTLRKQRRHGSNHGRSGSFPESAESYGHNSDASTADSHHGETVLGGRRID
eukprot:CAMPEP_0195293886 /NCGR_PEP_ID=MMETSP0707-20130614/13628_1 /TAXON_ID=33640 /ORGANISM="Asterionellopsis glacialis, Strain CCMP134" /LENGTH=224 /DNA_ID=CAMNT_0040354707 /DNA_START=146 /DNA_END=823 /DNA_ORIENTATION=+